MLNQKSLDKDLEFQNKFGSNTLEAYFEFFYENNDYKILPQVKLQQ